MEYYTSTPDLISSIKNAKEHNQFKQYINFIKFPYYRNLEINTEVKFEFPLTVFIGQNGCGKSSALHALFGTVRGNTPSKFWFDTKVDPVQYYDDEKRRHSFWYSYKDDKGLIKEVVKARIKRKNDPNYWETSRPLDWAGMKTKEDGTRDSPLKKATIYIDFRAELSAFDKFFYFGNTNGLSSSKQEFIRKKSSSLRSILSGEKDYIYSTKRKLNDLLEVLSPEELEHISFILGRKYTSAKSVKHSIFRNEGYSILFQTKYATYSEAFAGSGEMAVVRLVREVIKAPNYSLILLDEPEVSLHPGAQIRLQNFLLDQIKHKKHQIIITSHSPLLVNKLPKEAIKVFFQNPGNGRFLIKENLLPEEAFFHIEFPINQDLNLIVEDSLSKEILKSVLQKMGVEKENLFTISVHPGGATVLKKEFIPVYCRDGSSRNFIIFDGDQKRTHCNWKNIPTSDLTLEKLANEIKSQTNIDIKFSVDGGFSGANDQQRFSISKQYLDYYLSHVYYLPKNIPEEVIWNSDIAKGLLSTIYSNIDTVSAIVDLINALSFKEKFRELSKKMNESDKSDDILSIQKIFIKGWTENANDDYLSIQHIINQILQKNL